MSTKIFTMMAGRAAETALATQTGFAVLNFAPVALKVPAMAAVAAGGAAMGALDYYRDRADTNARRRMAQDEPSVEFAQGLVHALQRQNIDSNLLRRVVQSGVAAALGSAALGLAGVSGVLPVGLAFGAGAVGFPVAFIGFALASATLNWLLPRAVPAA